MADGYSYGWWLYDDALVTPASTRLDGGYLQRGMPRSRHHACLEAGKPNRYLAGWYLEIDPKIRRGMQNRSKINGKYNQKSMKNQPKIDQQSIKINQKSIKSPPKIDLRLLGVSWRPPGRVPAASPGAGAGGNSIELWVPRRAFCVFWSKFLHTLKHFLHILKHFLHILKHFYGLASKLIHPKLIHPKLMSFKNALASS